MVKKDMQSAIFDYFKDFTDLKITVNEMFLSEGRNQAGYPVELDRHSEERPQESHDP